MSTKVITGKVRFSYVHVHRPHSMDPKDEPKYSVSLIIDKDDTETLTRINKAIKEAIELGKTSKWGGKKPRSLKLPLRDGDDEREDDEAYENCFFVNANSKTKPGLVDKNRDEIIDPEEFYSGSYGRASITFYPYDNKGNKGVACGLNHLQKLSDGDPLGGVITSAQEDFDDDFGDFDDDFGDFEDDLM